MDIRQQGVIRFEPGIIEKEGIYFHTASAFAQQHLFLWSLGCTLSLQCAVQRAQKTFERIFDVLHSFG